MCSEPHRKRVRHYNEPGHCHELTFSCYGRMALLTNDVWRSHLSEAIDRANFRHGYGLAAFVFMPEHVHLLVYPETGASDIDQLIRAVKRPFGIRIKRLLQDTPGRLLERLTIQQRPGVQTFRYWQEGPGYDRNIDNPKTAMTVIDYIHRNLVNTAADWQWSSARWYQGTPYDPRIRVPKLTALPATFLDSTT